MLRVLIIVAPSSGVPQCFSSGVLLAIKFSQSLASVSQFLKSFSSGLLLVFSCPVSLELFAPGVSLFWAV